MPETHSHDRLLAWTWVAAQIVLFAAYVLVPACRPDYALPPWTRVPGLALAAAGAGLASAAMWVIRRQLTPLPLPTPATRLVTTGPFALVRHPVYAGILFAALGWSWWRLDASRALVAALLGIFFWFKARHEETHLTARFPREYPQYAARVKRLVPGVV